MFESVPSIVLWKWYSDLFPKSIDLVTNIENELIIRDFEPPQYAGLQELVVFKIVQCLIEDIEVGKHWNLPHFLYVLVCYREQLDRERIRCVYRELRR